MPGRRFIYLLMVLLLAASAADAAVLLSDNFDAENSGYPALNYFGFFNWTITDGSVDLIGQGSNGTAHDLLPGNGFYVDLDGSSNNSGTMTSKTAFLPGNYLFSFSLAGSQRGDANVVDVSFGNYAAAITRYSGDPFTTYTVAVQVIGAASPIIFQNRGGDNVGALLDNVTVTTPLPSTLLLLGGGFIGLVCGRRKLNK